MRVLAMRGLDRAHAEDLVQDVSVRAMAANITFDDLDDFLWWALPVVRNLHVDLLRSSKYAVPAGEMPDRESPAAPVEHVVERRLALQTVLQHLSELPEGEREAIVAAATDTQTDTGARAGTVAVRRHRARAHLRRLCSGVLGVSGIAAFGRRLRSVGIAATPVSVAAWLALPAVVAGLHVGTHVEPLPAVHVVNPKLGVAVSVRMDRLADTNDTPARAVTQAGGATGTNRSASSLNTPILAPSRVEAATPRHSLVVKHYENEGAPLLCLQTGGRTHDRCLAQPVHLQDVTVNVNVSLR